MSLFEPFIRRYVGTSLVAIGIMLLGAVAYCKLPVAPLPQVDFPTIQVTARLPGASADTMAATVATPLERALSAVAQVTSMTSSSSLGTTQITLQFDLSRKLDGAAQDVQTALTAAAGNLPKDMPDPPTFHKVNPAEGTVLSLALTSETRSLPELDQYAEDYLGQQISQMTGVGLVDFHGQQRPAVRIQIDPDALAARGLTLEDVRGIVGLSTVNTPKGSFNGHDRTTTLNSTDQLLNASQYRDLVVAYKGGLPVRVRDIGKVVDAAEDIRQLASFMGKPAVIVDIHKQPGFNVIETIAAIEQALPGLSAHLPRDVQVQVVGDRTQTVDASIRDMQFALVLAIALVVGVIFVFLRNASATLIPALAIPLSLLATFGVLWLLGASLDNLSVMALAIAVGFVVDDAVVVTENIVRHLDMGKTARQAAIDGVAEVGFTVLSMTLSLIAVFIPILLMSGIVGRLFREFAVTVSVAVLMSGIVSLVVTPMLCAKLLRHGARQSPTRASRAMEHAFDRVLAGYRRSLDAVLRRQGMVLAGTVAMVFATAALYVLVPKGFFPTQDTGQLSGIAESSPDVGFGEMRSRVAQLTQIVQEDAAVQNVYSWIGPNPTLSQARIIVNLKPQTERADDASAVLARLRKNTAVVPGILLFLQVRQDVQVGARVSKAQYQYTLQGTDNGELARWSGVLLDKLRASPLLADITSDRQALASQTTLVINRDAASRLGVTAQDIDNVLYDAFGQRQVATLFTQLDQNRVILELDPRWQVNSESLAHLYVRSSLHGNLVPLDMLGHLTEGVAPITINHQGPFPAVTLSFNLAKGISLGQAVSEIQRVAARIGMPDSITGTFQGTAASFQSAMQSQPWLILAAVICVYILLGVLYESAIHPLTIISSLPSAGIGALLALILCGHDLSIMGMIGILLLVGIVKKNAIMMVDFALAAERSGMRPVEAIREGCLLRFRPIMMTTMAALFGAVPLALNLGSGAEFRQPLGIAIVGGLIVSQVLTLYTTPVVYLWFSRWAQRKPRLQGFLSAQR